MPIFPLESLCVTTRRQIFVKMSIAKLEHLLSPGGRVGSRSALWTGLTSLKLLEGVIRDLHGALPGAVKGGADGLPGDATEWGDF